MNRIMMVAIVACSLSFIEFVYADQSTVATIISPTPWSIKSSTDEVTINNGNGNNITITINVDKNTTINLSGVNLKNCGNTTHIDAGSSAVCSTHDASNPVSFSSDSHPTYNAHGTYLIKLN